MALRTPSGANVLVYFGIQIVLDCFTVNHSRGCEMFS